MVILQTPRVTLILIVIFRSLKLLLMILIVMVRRRRLFFKLRLFLFKWWNGRRNRLKFLLSFRPLAGRVELKLMKEKLLLIGLVLLFIVILILLFVSLMLRGSIVIIRVVPTRCYYHHLNWNPARGGTLFRLRLLLKLFVLKIVFRRWNRRLSKLLRLMVPWRRIFVLFPLSKKLLLLLKLRVTLRRQSRRCVFLFIKLMRGVRVLTRKLLRKQLLFILKRFLLLVIVPGTSFPRARLLSLRLILVKVMSRLLVVVLTNSPVLRPLPVLGGNRRRLIEIVLQFRCFLILFRSVDRRSKFVLMKFLRVRVAVKLLILLSQRRPRRGPVSRLLSSCKPKNLILIFRRLLRATFVTFRRFLTFAWRRLN